MLDIQIEVIVTVIAALVTALIVIVANQRNASRRTRLKDNIGLLRLERDRKGDSGDFERLIKPKLEHFVDKERPRIGAGFLGSVVFWIAVCAAFAWWTFVLVQQGLLMWAPLAGFFALLGLVMPFITGVENRHANNEMERLIRGVEAYEQAPEELATREREAEVKVEARQETKPRREAKDTTVVTAPEDSTLKRHFLTTLRAEIESGLPLRPTDSALRRHHDAMIEAELDTRLGGQLSELRLVEAAPATPVTLAPTAPIRLAPTAEVRVKHKPIQDERLMVPEDSTLKRHFLTKLRAEIEAALPPRPADSALRRHFDSMVDAQMEQRLAGHG